MRRPVHRFAGGITPNAIPTFSAARYASARRHLPLPLSLHAYAKALRSPDCRSPSSRRSRTARSITTLLREQVEFQIAAGTTCLVPGRHDGRIADAVARRARAGDRRRGASRGGPHQGHAGHRLEQHGRSAAADASGPPKDGADAALMVAPYYNKPTQEGFYQHFKALAEAVGIADLRLQHSRPHRQEHRAGNDRPAGRAAEHHDGQGSDRLARPGLADSRADRTSRCSAATTA